MSLFYECPLQRDITLSAGQGHLRKPLPGITVVDAASAASSCVALNGSISCRWQWDCGVLSALQDQGVQPKPKVAH